MLPFVPQTIRLFVIAGLASTLAACGGSNYSDIDQYMSDVKAMPAGQIKPIPPFKAYKAFTYGATGLRSPFDKPLEISEITRLQAISAVKPDETRAKEFLEQFSLDSLEMVGSLQQANTLWALLLDREGGVHRITNGNYVGRNHGKIIETTETYVAVIEIVPNGVDGWVERPRTIKLKVTD
jgi:type IV pilus assembly protein PilP